MENVGEGGTQLLGGQRSLRGQGEEALVTLEARGGPRKRCSWIPQQMKQWW